MFASDGNCDSVSDSANVRINFRKNNTKLLFCDKILPPPISARPIVLSDRRDEGPGAVCGRPPEDRAGVRTGTGIFGARCGGRGCLRLLPEGGLRARPQEPGWGGPGRERCGGVFFRPKVAGFGYYIYICRRGAGAVPSPPRAWGGAAVRCGAVPSPADLRGGVAGPVAAAEKGAEGR